MVPEADLSRTTELKWGVVTANLNRGVRPSSGELWHHSAPARPLIVYGHLTQELLLFLPAVRPFNKKLAC